MALPETQTDVLVVGGGITGCALAYYLARFGVEVLAIERGELNSQASGSNAGSLHAQISYKDFTSADDAWLRGYGPVLRFLVAGIEAWKEIAPELDTDTEFVIEGGLMVAETDAEMRGIERKVAFERAQGLENTIISQAELRDRSPHLSRRMIGGAYSPYEGRINSAYATPAVLRAALRAGARFERHVELYAIHRSAKRIDAETNRGQIRAERLVIAAGSWCDPIAAMVGVRFPVEGCPIHCNVTEAVPRCVDHLIYSAARPLTLKQATTGQLIIGGGWPAAGSPAGGFPACLRSTVEGNLSTAMAVLPAMAHMRLLRSWAGFVNLIPDARPLIGPVPGVPGIFIATFPNMGYTAGILCGKLAAELIAGKAPSFDPEIATPERFAA